MPNDSHNKAITDIFIKRPVFATVLSLVILLVGLMSFSKMPLRQFPKLQSSVITISTSYPGASAKLMEGFVTTPLEASLAGVDGLDYMTSSNSQGQSTITLFFKLGYDINKAITDVGDKVSSARYELPRDVNDPVIRKQDPNADPIMYIAFQSKHLSPEAISDYLTRVVQPQLETLNGVAQAEILGEQTYAMRILLNPKLMAAHDISASDVEQTLQNNNVQAAAGRIEGGLQEFNINAKTDLSNAREFNNLIIKEQHGHIIRLRDIGHAELGAADKRAAVLMNGQPSVVVAIISKSDANPLNVARLIRATLPTIHQHLPRGLSFKVMWDSSQFISQSIHEVYKTILEACAFVILVIFLFLGSFRSVIIPVVTIPLSLIGSGLFMLALGFTVNTLTLLAWVLAIGMVVDDAIVVVENIHRRIEDGMQPWNAALTGAREIRFAIIAMTLTLAAVFAPIGFLEGLTGTLFREFAFTLAGTVIVSGFIALTLSPMMCSKLLRHTENKRGLEARVDKIFNAVRSGYQHLLSILLKRRAAVLIGAVVVLILGGLLFHTTPQELAPTEDQGMLMMFAQGPSSANLAYMQKNTKRLEKIFTSIPEIDTYGLILGWPQGVNSALSFLILKPWNERQRSALQIKNELFPQLWSIPSIMAFPSLPPPLPGTSGFTPIDFVLKTTQDYPVLERAAQKILMQLRKDPRFENPDVSLKTDQPQIDIKVDRDKAADMGVSMSAIANSLNLLLGEPVVTRFTMQGRSYDVVPELLPQYRRLPQQLNNINVHTNTQKLVPLSNLVRITNIVGPRRLQHFQQLRAAHITASLTPGFTLGDALTTLNNMAKQSLPHTIQVDYAGQSRQFVAASGAMLYTFIFAILFIFLVLAAQFESFRSPVIILLFSVPLSVTGALVAMHLTASTLNIYTEIGLVTLIGLIAKHGILLVEFANQLQAKGVAVTEAITQAASIRLRPILMTTFAMILGALPLALASGAGAAARQQIGWVIIGGMAIGTLFTLFVVPASYSYLAKPPKTIPEV